MWTKVKEFVWPYIRSSQDPQKLSLTLKSIASTLGAFAVLFGVALPQEDVDSLVHGVEVLITAVWAGTSGVGVIYGVARKYRKPKS